MNKRVDTICRNCLFARYKESTQIGCEFHRVFKFGRNGTKIIAGCDDPANPPVDGYREYFVLENTACNTARPRVGDGNIEEETLNELKDIVRKQVRIYYNWILVNRTGNEADIINRLAEIKGQSIAPVRVCVIRYESSPIHPQTLASLLTKRFKLWDIENLLDENASVDQGIDALLLKRKTPFYFLSNDAEPISPYISTKVDEAVNDRLIRFAKLNIENISIIPTLVHLTLQGGMFGTTLQEKIENICPEKMLNL